MYIHSATRELISRKRPLLRGTLMATMSGCIAAVLGSLVESTIVDCNKAKDKPEEIKKEDATGVERAWVACSVRSWPSEMLTGQGISNLFLGC